MSGSIKQRAGLLQVVHRLPEILLLPVLGYFQKLRLLQPNLLQDQRTRFHNFAGRRIHDQSSARKAGDEPAELATSSGPLLTTLAVTCGEAAVVGFCRDFGIFARER
jgi:hypothetical protein